MKKRVNQEIAVCDVPGCEKTCGVFDHCLGCGKDFCGQHRKETGVAYWNTARPGGFGCYFYCTPCDVALAESESDSLHRALLAIKRLREEGEAFTRAYNQKARACDVVLNSHLPEQLRLGR